MFFTLNIKDGCIGNNRLVFFKDGRFLFPLSFIQVIMRISLLLNDSFRDLALIVLVTMICYGNSIFYEYFDTGIENCYQNDLPLRNWYLDMMKTLLKFNHVYWRVFNIILYIMCAFALYLILKHQVSKTVSLGVTDKINFVYGTEAAETQDWSGYRIIFPIMSVFLFISHPFHVDIIHSLAGHICLLQLLLMLFSFVLYNFSNKSGIYLIVSCFFHVISLLFHANSAILVLLIFLLEIARELIFFEFAASVPVVSLHNSELSGSHLQRRIERFGQLNNGLFTARLCDLCLKIFNKLSYFVYLTVLNYFYRNFYTLSVHNIMLNILEFLYSLRYFAFSIIPFCFSISGVCFRTFLLLIFNKHNYFEAPIDPFDDEKLTYFYLLGFIVSINLVMILIYYGENDSKYQKENVFHLFFCASWFLLPTVLLCRNILDEIVILIPSVGFCFLVGYIFSIIIEKSRFFALIPLSLICYNSISTINRNLDWTSECSFWQRTSFINPKDGIYIFFL